MAIFTALALIMALTVPAGIYEGIQALHRRAREQAEWRHLKAYYYPNGRAWRYEDTCSM